MIIRRKREKGNTFFVSPEEITEVKEEFCVSGGRDAVTQWALKRLFILSKYTSDFSFMRQTVRSWFLARLNFTN